MLVIRHPINLHSSFILSDTFKIEVNINKIVLQMEFILIKVLKFTSNADETNIEKQHKTYHFYKMPFVR